MIRFAGIDLLAPDAGGRTAEFLSRYLALRLSSIFGQSSELADAGSGVPRVKWPAEPPLRVNTLVWPTGATRWAYGAFLAAYDQKEAVLASLATTEEESRVATTGDALLQICDGDYAGVLFSADEAGGYKTDGLGRVLFAARMRLLPPRPVSVVDGEQADSLWILPLVDERYFWRNRPVPSDFAPTTWAVAIGEIGEALGLDAIEFDEYGPEQGTAENAGVAQPNENAAALLDFVAENLGRRVVRDPDGTVTVQTVAEAITRLDENLSATVDRWSRVAGGVFSSEATVETLPETVRVVFTDADGAAVETEEVAYSDLVEGGDGFDEDAPALPSAPPKTGDVAVLTTADARFDSPAAEDYTDLARSLARSWYLWRSRPYDVTFASVKRWLPTGFDDAVELSFAPSPDEACVLTRVWSLPQAVTVGDPGLDASSSDFAAVANGSIAAGATGTLFRADSSWAETTAEVTALNPSGVTIADGTKCIVGKVRPIAGWVIKQALLCTEGV